MKKNKVVKIIASVLLTLSVLAAALSGILIASVGSRNLSRGSAQAIYDDYLEGLVLEQESEVQYYYIYYLQSLEGAVSDHTISSYKNEFAEENSNYFFRVTPQDTEKQPGLANYYTDDYQYHATTSCEQQFYKDEQVITCELPLSAIVEAWEEAAVDVFDGEGYGVYNTELYDGYYEDDYSVSYDGEYDGPEYSGYYYKVNGREIYLPREIEEQYGRWESISSGDVWIDYADAYVDDAIKKKSVYLMLEGTNFRYNLTNNANFQNEYNELLRSTDGDGLYCNDISYDGEKGILRVSFSVTETVAFQLDSYVKTTFTAHDDFYNSIFLKYCRPIVRMLPYVFVISILLIVALTVYLASAAGHRTGEDTITCNLFDRIPYDLFLLFYILLFIAWYGIMSSYYSREMTIFLSIVCGSVCAAMFPPTLMTTATRLKVQGWGMFKNTVIWRLLGLLKRFAVYVWKKLVQLFSFLGRYFNLYWKWLGVFLLLESIKFVALASASLEIALFVTIVCDLFLVYELLMTIRRLYTLKNGADRIAKGDVAYTIDTTHMPHELKEHGENLNSIRDGIRLAVEERIKSERMKTELITNVSHDIKTPLTSIISYVDLISKEEGLSKTEQEYVEVLQRQSARLKKLIEDLIEASKASTGNLELHLEKTDVEVLVNQILGEYENKLETHGLHVIVTNHLQTADGNENAACVMADGRHLWRVFENLMGNITKYAQENSRVYIDIDNAMQNGMLQVTFKNISAEALNISGDELMERFVRGDRSRNTEGSGLGLSIARNLMELQGGKVEIMIDGDLFKVVLLLKK